MPQESIFLPMLALAALTFGVLLFIPIRRFRAVFAGQVTPADFSLGESPAVPPVVALANRNYMNLLELPILFYAVCVAMFVTQTVDSLAMNLAWAYVALRVIHSVIHLTYNKVTHRLTAFALSNFPLVGLWILFGMRVTAAA
jgi:hypothetical protein